MTQFFQLLRYRHIGTDEARHGTCLSSISAWQVVAERAGTATYPRSE